MTKNQNYYSVSFNKDVIIFLSNIFKIFDPINKSFTFRKRCIDFNDVYYFISKYNASINASYNTTLININNDLLTNNSDCDFDSNIVSYQAYLKRRENITISDLNNINSNLLSKFYSHIQNDLVVKVNKQRILACDGSQLNFLVSLSDHFNSNTHHTYSYAYLNCLFDVDNKIPISYAIDKTDERSLLLSQLKYCTSNDIIVADRGYFSNDLINQLHNKNIKFVLRISRNIDYYINNIDVINSKNEGSIIIEPNDKFNSQLKLVWYQTRNNDNAKKELENIEKNIKKNIKELDILNVKIDDLNLKSSNILKENKNIITQINILKSKKKCTKILNNKLEINRNKRNNIKYEIKLLIENKENNKKTYQELYVEKEKLLLDINSVYIIITNDITKSIENIKEIYKKRWEVETHFKFAKELFKFDNMDTKNVEYIKQNILITQFMFIIEGYIEYIANKLIDKTKMINRTSAFESLKNKLLLLILKNNSTNNNLKLILKLILEIIKFVLKIIKIIEHKQRIKKRPQKNHYNSNIR